MNHWLLLGVCTLLAAAHPALAQDSLVARTVRLVNSFGGVHASVTFERELSIQADGISRPTLQGDVVLSHDGELVTVACQPSDGAEVNLTVGIPFGLNLEIETKGGAITLRGMVAKASLSTADGDIRVAAPWKATSLTMLAVAPPRSLESALAVWSNRQRNSADESPRWELRDQLSVGWATFGEVAITAERPGHVVFEDMPLPPEAPVRLPWQAPDAIQSVLRGVPAWQQAYSARPGKPPGYLSSTPDSAEEHHGVTFRSDVRMVNLTVSVTGTDGQPVLDLLSSDFEAVENGVPQQIAAFNSEEAPFNLVLLLDLSDSTLIERGAMKEAARRFVKVARPSDRLAVYALANNRMTVISPLTSDHVKLVELLEQIPEVGGGSPLYDTIALAYEYELYSHRGERNALLVITDGLDNGLRPAGFERRTPRNEQVLRRASQGTPSQTRFADLKRFAGRMEALVYVVYLEDAAQDAGLPSEFATEARKNLKEIAEISAGRLFTAKSVLDWDPVHEVAKELRGLYTLAYYPANQNFDGKFRKVVVKVRGMPAAVRARAGYYAQ